MSERLTAWEGHNVDGTPRAVIAKRDGLFPDLLQPILKKLAEYEDAEAHPEHTFWATQLEAIRKLPAADVRPVVRAKWLDDWETGCSECSVCHDSFLWEDFKGVADWHFCPNCGADMREES